MLIKKMVSSVEGTMLIDLARADIKKPLLGPNADFPTLLVEVISSVLEHEVRNLMQKSLLPKVHVVTQLKTICSM